MIKINKSWESGFCLVSLLLLVSIPFGYFLGNLAFAIWVLYSLYWIISIKNFKPNKQVFPFLFFSLILFASLLWSQDYTLTIHAIGRQLPLFFFALIGLFLPKISKEKIEHVFLRFALFLCLLAFVLVAIAVLKYTKYQYKDFLFYHDLVSPLDLNAIYVSYIVSVVFLITLQKLCKKNSWLLLVLLILFTFLIMLSSKMILFITVLISMTIGFFKVKGKIKKLVVLIFLVFIALGSLKFLKPLQDRFSTEFKTSFVEIFNEESFEKGRPYTGLEARLLQVRVFTNIINTPLEYILGVGLDASKKEVKVIHKKLNTPTVFQSYNFHNQYLQVLTELGVIGFIALMMILIVGLKKSLKINFLLPFIVVTIALFFTESVIWRQRGIMFFSVMYILLMAIGSNYESKESISEV